MSGREGDDPAVPARGRRDLLRGIGVAGVGATLATTAGANAPPGEDWARPTGIDARTGEPTLAVADGWLYTGGVARGPDEEFYSGYVTKTSTKERSRWGRTPGKDVDATHSLTTMVPAVDGGVVFGGSEGQSAWLGKLSPDGELAWDRTFDWSDEGDRIHELVPTDDGYAFAASSVDAADERGDAYDVVVGATDASGAESWRQRYGFDHQGLPFDLTPTADGGFLVAGASDGGGMLLSVGPEGDRRWARRDRFRRDGVTAVESAVETADGAVLVVGSQKTSSASPGSILMSKIAPGGDAIWTNSHSGVTAHDALATDDGYVFAGEARSSGGGTDALLVGTDENGRAQWRRRYSTDGDDAAVELDDASGGRYAAVGRARGGSSTWEMVFSPPPSEGLEIAFPPTDTGSGSGGGSSPGDAGGSGDAPADEGTPAGSPTRNRGDPGFAVDPEDYPVLAAVGVVLDLALIGVAWVGYRWYREDGE